MVSASGNITNLRGVASKASKKQKETRPEKIEGSPGQEKRCKRNSLTLSSIREEKPSWGSTFDPFGRPMGGLRNGDSECRFYSSTIAKVFAYFAR